MKTTALFAMLAIIGMQATGCASPYPQGILLTDLTLPVAATSNSGKATKVGTATCTSLLGLVTQGDASLEAAKKNGGITKVYHVDWKAKNILGIIGEYTLTVYGE